MFKKIFEKIRKTEEVQQPKKLLIRGAVTPLESSSVQDVVRLNNFGGNAGNLLYAFSVFRTLLTENTEIVIDHYAGEEARYSEKDIDFINQEYDAFVVPLADAFRKDFAKKLNVYADLFRKLKIPCYVIGVGMRAPYEPDLQAGFPFDDAVKNFVSAALEKSSLIGLRGEITADYLKTLGFVPEKDYTVIGCPSMFTFGKHLQQRPLNLNPESRISINYNASGPDPAVKFLNDLAVRYPNSQYVGQRSQELVNLYIGKSEAKGASMSQYYPYDHGHFLYREDKVRFFVSAMAWYDNMRTVDLSIGGRMHGNIAAVLGGAPAVFMPLDSRMRELLAYHGLAQIPMFDITAETTLEDLLGSMDLQLHLKKQEKNFNHFVDFLDKNGIGHIYGKDRDRQDAPLDALLPRNPELVLSVDHCTREEAMERIFAYYKNEMDKKDKQIANLKGKIKRLNEDLKAKNG